jgi:hypothetical protein
LASPERRTRITAMSTATTPTTKTMAARLLIR